jgi:hypothetical protein
MNTEGVKTLLKNACRKKSTCADDSNGANLEQQKGEIRRFLPCPEINEDMILTVERQMFVKTISISKLEGSGMNERCV